MEHEFSSKMLKYMNSEKGTAFIVSHYMPVIAHEANIRALFKIGNNEFCGNPAEAISDTPTIWQRNR